MTKHYTKQHEWLEPSEGNISSVGISDFAQSQLGDIVFIDLPEVGRQAKQGEIIAVIESVKSASDIYMPVDGTIKEINPQLADQPELVNASPEQDGWLFKLQVEEGADTSHLLSKEDYLKGTSINS